jgi:hypothetical protein
MVYDRIYKNPTYSTERTKADGFLIKKAPFCTVVARLFIYFDAVAILTKTIHLTYPSLYLRASTFITHLQKKKNFQNLKPGLHF